MYVGRIVAAGMADNGGVAVMYRVSSRSFPNRRAVTHGDMVAIMPSAGHEGDMARNPYIAYNCLRLARGYAVAANGSHTDPIAEKIAAGMPPRESIALALLAMDYEKDQLDTPRIAAVAAAGLAKAWLGVVRKDALLVEEFELTPGVAFYLSTYERAFPSRGHVDQDFRVADAAEACARIMGKGVFAELDKPVTAAAAFADANAAEFQVATAQTSVA